MQFDIKDFEVETWSTEGKYKNIFYKVGSRGKPNYLKRYELARFSAKRANSNGIPVWYFSVANYAYKDNAIWIYYGTWSKKALVEFIQFLSTGNVLNKIIFDGIFI